MQLEYWICGFRCMKVFSVLKKQLTRPERPIKRIRIETSKPYALNPVPQILNPKTPQNPKNPAEP